MTQNDVCEIFRQRLIEMRKKKGLTYEKLANLIGVTHPCVFWWEHGRNCPRLEYLPALAKVLGVTVDWLLGAEVEDETRITV